MFYKKKYKELLSKYERLNNLYNKSQLNFTLLKTDYEVRKLTQKEYDLLKEVLL